MATRPNRLNWFYDNELQQFTTPCGGVVTLAEIAQLLQDRITCTHDFAGPWTGWRMRQNRLIAPGQTFRTANINTSNLRAFSRWLRSYEGEQAQLEFHTKQSSRCEQQQTSPGRAESPISPTGNEQHPIQAKSESQEPAPVRAVVHAARPRDRAKVVQLADYRRELRDAAQR